MKKKYNNNTNTNIINVKIDVEQRQWPSNLELYFFSTESKHNFLKCAVSSFIFVFSFCYWVWALYSNSMWEQHQNEWNYGIMLLYDRWIWFNELFDSIVMTNAYGFLLSCFFNRLIGISNYLTCLIIYISKYSKIMEFRFMCTAYKYYFQLKIWLSLFWKRLRDENKNIWISKGE